MKFSLFLMLAATLLFNGCRPESFSDLGIPADNINSLNGTWKLDRVIQTDADARQKGFPYQSLDITNFFPFQDFRLTVDVAAKTFSTTPGNAPQVIELTSGTWSADNEDAAKNLELVNGTDTAIVVLGSYPNAVNPKLKLKVERKDNAGKVLIIYDYEFSKQ